MIFNISKRQMYFLLKDFNKTKNFKSSIANMSSKFKMDNSTTGFRVYEVVANHYIEGVNCNKTMANTYVNTLSNYIFITSSGYEFLKDYYGFIRKILWELFIIVTTAVVTIMLNNKFSISNKDTSSSNNDASQCVSNIGVFNNDN